MVLLASALMEPICVRRKPVAILLISVLMEAVAILLISAFVEAAVILLISVLMEWVVAVLCQGFTAFDVPGVLQLVLDRTGIFRAVTPVPKLVLDHVDVFRVPG